MRANTGTKPPHHTSLAKEFDDDIIYQRQQEEQRRQRRARAAVRNAEQGGYIECHIANMLWIADTEVRAQMQKEVAAESGIDESY